MTIALTEECRACLRHRRLGQNLTVAELAKAANISQKTIKDVENPNSTRERFDEQTLVRTCRALGITLDDLMNSTTLASDHVAPPSDFVSISQRAEVIDAGLMPIIRSLRLGPKSIDEAFQDLLRERLRKKGIVQDRFLVDLLGNELSDVILKTMPKPDLDVWIADGFQHLKFSFGKTELQIDNPRLLWDCHCGTPGARQPPRSCPIHAHPQHDELSARFRSGYVLMHFRGARFLWHDSRGLWPPSIDSFLMYEDLRAIGLHTAPISTLLDLGSGTGFLGIMLARENPSVSLLDLADWMLTPMIYGRMNWLLNSETRTYVLLGLKLGLMTRWFDQGSQPYDVVLCNPPYLPLLDGFDELGLESAVGSTDLLVHVIRNAPKIGRQVFVQFSHLALPEALAAAKEANVKLEPVADRRSVPFRLPAVWKQPRYIDRLRKRRGLERRSGERHPFWHYIQTFSIECSRQRI